MTPEEIEALAEDLKELQKDFQKSADSPCFGMCGDAATERIWAYESCADELKYLIERYEL